MTRLFFFALVSIAPLAIAEPVDQLSKGIGQLSASIDWIPDPADNALTCMVQKTSDDRLFLTPNECFFPKLGLTAEGTGAVPDVANLNGGNSFESVAQWDEGDQAEWGLWLPKSGEIDVHIALSGSDPGDFLLELDGNEKKVAARRSKGATPALAARLTFQIATPGKKLLRLTNTGKGSADTRLHWIEISGTGARDGAVLRKRWRPAAAHTKFTSSKSPGNVRLWVMEMDAAPGDLGFYAPITTPFGYYGPTWNADGTVNTSFNFSLWSFGRGEKEPPIERLSHLLAIGNRDATFGGFDHEGTGVKIRDWEPLTGRQGQRQALALRVEPGKIHDTYFSYFYATDEQRWRLFGVGKKKTKRDQPLDSLWVGSFVEVPGPPPRQRTGPYPRRMLYRGWVMDARDKWYPLDQMATGNVDKETGLTHTDRGLNEAGWFYLETGGWAFRKPPSGDHIKSRPSGRPDVSYLEPEDLKALTTVPSSIEVTKVERAGNKARITFEILNPGEKPEVLAYWGATEGLTFADRWKNKAEADRTAEGANQLILENVPQKGPLLVRMFLRNDDGQFWSMETASGEAR